MARPGKLVPCTDADTSHASIGMKACLHSRSIDREIIDTVSQGHCLSDKDVHDTRVNIKRLRAMRQLVYFETGYEHFKQGDNRLKNTGKLLSNRRDQTVLASTLKKLAEHAKDDESTRSVLAILSYVQETNAENELGNKNLQNRVKASIIEDEDDWSKIQHKLACTDTLLAGLARTYGNARLLGQRVMQNDAIALAHRWRKWCKYLYYQVEFVSQLCAREGVRIEKDLKRVGNALGLRHDIANLALVLARLQQKNTAVDKDAERVRALSQEWDSELKGECKALFKKIFWQSPVTFSEKIQGLPQQRKTTRSSA